MRLLKATYINHKGRRISFGNGDGLFLNEHDLYNYNWNAVTRGNRIVNVNRRGVVEHTLPLIIVADTEEQAYRYANNLFSVFEADLYANQKGSLLVNGFYLKCFVKGQEYTEWTKAEGCLKIFAKVIRDSIWYKPLETITFNASGLPQAILIEEEQIAGSSPAGSAASADWSSGEKGYFYGYPYDYPSTLEEYLFENKTGGPLSWQATIFGAASAITFYIGDHTYSVDDVTLNNGDKLIITAKEALDEKTIIKIASDGTQTNCFANRSSTSYLFEPIPEGSHVIRSASNLTWRLTPIIERSAPEWL